MFGPDGYLYLGIGDGGSRGDPAGNAQNRNTLLGSILRIDVKRKSLNRNYVIPPTNPFVGEEGLSKPEIWAFGLRNPWRITFDKVTGALWAGDVGQDVTEEIDIIKPGLNYGWNIMEGTRCYRPSRSGCERSIFEAPIFEYGRDNGCAVIGGYVYRGERLVSLYGAYIYGDYCSGKVWALWHDGENLFNHIELVDLDVRIASFGEDQEGEIYVLSLEGEIYRLVSGQSEK